MAADYVFVNGEVLTVDAEDQVVEAVAVEGNRIVAVGTSDDVLRLRGSETQTIDLDGRTLLPGFIDAHVHLLLRGTDHLGVNSKDGIASIEDLKARLVERAGETPAGQWVRGWGYNDLKLTEKRHPTREDLDAVSTEHPIIAIRACGHISVVNSKALEVLGISRDSPDPEGGEIGRGANGELNGILKETAHMSAYDVAQYGPEELARALEIADKEFVRLGITSIHDAGGFGAHHFRAMARAVADRRVNVRIYAMVGALNHSEDFVAKMIAAGIITGVGDERFRVGPAKIFTDGSSSGPTAAMREPYTHDPSDSGILYFSQEEIDRILGAAHEAGFQITAHAMGDKAVEMVVNCIERCLKEHPRDDHRHRIEHIGFAPPDLLARIKKLGIVPTPNPAFFYEFGESYIRSYGDRVEHMFPLADYAREGVTVACGSDAPVTIPSPIRGIYCAVTRRTELGAVVGASQRTTLLHAIRTFTINGAYASFEEGVKGSIEVGKLADLVALDGSILSATPDKLLTMQPTMTMIDGEVVFDGNQVKDPSSTV